MYKTFYSTVFIIKKTIAVRNRYIISFGFYFVSFLKLDSINKK